MSQEQFDITNMTIAQLAALPLKAQVEIRSLCLKSLQQAMQTILILPYPILRGIVDELDLALKMGEVTKDAMAKFMTHVPEAEAQMVVDSAARTAALTRATVEIFEKTNQAIKESLALGFSDPEETV